MPLEKAGIELIAETSQYSRNINRIIADSTHVDAAMMDIVRSAERADAALNDIDSAVTARVDVDTSELDTARRLYNDLDEPVSTRVNVEDSELQSLHDTIQGIHDMSVINLAINIAEPITNVAEGILQSSGAGGILEMDSALAQLQGRTGRMIPQAEHLIRDLYTNAWGESRSQIGEVITEAANLGIEMDNLEEAVQTAFFVQDVSPDKDPREILRTMQTMVRNGLVPDFKTAGDVLVAGIQNGLDRGDDLLDTFNEYGSTFKELRISGEAAIGLLNSGLSAGIDNTDRIADAVREIGIRLTEISEDENLQARVAELEDLSGMDISGMIDTYLAGQMSGDEFFNGFFDALSKAATRDPVAADRIATDLVGTIAEDFGLQAVSQLTPEWDTAMGTLEGRAEEASNTINDTIVSKLTEAQRTIEDTIAGLLESEAVNLDERLDVLKRQLGTFTDELQGGATIGKALEIALEIPGLENQINRLESVLGNVALAIVDAFAAGLDLIGQGDAAAALRESITGLAGGQLTFDLKLATSPEELQEAINTAVERGVDLDTISDALNTALSELAAEGDVPGFTALAHAAEESLGVDLGGTIADVMQDALDTALESGDLDLAQSILDQAELEGVGAEMRDTLVSGISEAMAAGNFEDALDIAEMLGEENMITAVQEMAAAAGENFDAMAGSAEAAEQRIDDAVNRHSIVPDIMAVSEAARVHLPAAGNEILLLGQMAEQGFGQASYWALAVANSFMTLGNTLPILQGINSELTAMAGLGTAARQVMESIPTPGGGAGNTTIINNNQSFSQTNNNASAAQAGLSNAQVSRQIRGLAA